MVAKFLDHNNRESSFATATENSKKAIGLDWQKSNFARASRFFVHFLALLHDCARFMESVSKNAKIFFFFRIQPRKVRHHLTN